MSHTPVKVANALSHYTSLVQRLYTAEEAARLIAQFEKVSAEWGLHSDRLTFSDYIVRDDQEEVVGFVRVQYERHSREVYGGFVELIEDSEVAELLANLLKQEARGRALLFPVDLSIWHRYRFFVDGTPDPLFDMPSKSYYASLFAPFFGKHEAYSSYEQPLSELLALIKTLPKAAAEIRLRTIDLSALESECKLAHELSRAIFIEARSAPTFAEFMALYGSMLKTSEPKLTLFAEYDGKPIGFCFSVKQGARLAIKTIGILPDFQGGGVGPLLIAETARHAQQLGCEVVHYNYLRDDRRISRMVPSTAKRTARYILYLA